MLFTEKRLFLRQYGIINLCVIGSVVLIGIQHIEGVLHVFLSCFEDSNCNNVNKFVGVLLVIGSSIAFSMQKDNSYILKG